MNERVSNPLIGVELGLKFEDINQCQTESDDNSNENSENIVNKDCSFKTTSEENLEDKWYSQIKSVQIDTLNIQRKFSSEFKSESFCNNLTSSPPSKARLLRQTLKPTAVAPKNKIEKQVVDFKSQLLTIETLIKASPKPESSTREEIKLKIKSRQKVLQEMDPEVRSKPLKSKKPPAPPPPQFQTTVTTPMSSALPPKIVVTKQSESSSFNVYRPTSFGAQWKKVQHSTPVKFLTDSSPLRKNFKGFKKAFKSNEDAIQSSESNRLSDASLNSLTFSMDDAQSTSVDDYMMIKILKNLDLEKSKINQNYLSELVDILAKRIDCEDTTSESSESEDEVISEMALLEIAAFEKLIIDYKQEMS